MAVCLLVFLCAADRASAQEVPTEDVPPFLLPEADAAGCAVSACADLDFARLWAEATAGAVFDRLAVAEAETDRFDRLGVEIAGPLSAAAGALRRGTANVWATPVVAGWEDGAALTRGSSDIYGVNAGLDGEVAPGLRLGAIYGFRHSAMDRDRQAQTFDRDSHTVTVFAKAEVAEGVSLRLGGAHGWSETDAARRPAGFPRLEGRFDGTNWSVFGGVSGREFMGRIYTTAAANLLYSASEQEGYTESVFGIRVPGTSSHLGQLETRVSAGLFERLSDRVSLYPALSLSYRYDFATDRTAVPGTEETRHGLRAGAGLHLLARRGLTAGIEGNYEFLRGEQSGFEVKPVLRWKF